jgi:hypothetical protein
MNRTNLMNNQFESTYALLVRSEEKSRNVVETVLYVAFFLSAFLSMWQFAQYPVKIPAAGLQRCIVCEMTRPQTITQS